MSQFNESQFSATYQNLTQYVPWGWVLTPTDPGLTCPSSSSILGTFAAENAVMLLIPLIFSNSFIMEKITFRLLGGNEKDKTWRYSWIFPFVLQHVGNAIIAILKRDTPGYRATFSNGDLVMLYTIRPRLNWLFLCAIYAIPGYWNSFVATMLVEFVLQCMGVYYTAWTLHFANAQGYLAMCGEKVCNPVGTYRPGAGALYVGAMVYIVFFSLFSMMALYNIACMMNWDAPDEDDRKLKWLGLGLGLPFLLTWVGSWVSFQRGCFLSWI